MDLVMHRSRARLLALIAVSASVLGAFGGCGGSGDASDPLTTAGTGGAGGVGGSTGHGGASGAATGAGGAAGAAANAGGNGPGGASPGAGGSPAGGAAGATSNAGAPGCVVTMCQSHVYECGDCIDNDGDGLIDLEDPDCLNHCSNNESGFLPGIPGGNNAPCKQDCYFDQDTGPGNDDCYWDHRCDPLEVSPAFDPEGNGCGYDPKTKFPMSLGVCADVFATQSKQCHDFCGPLTPNGCDCFGCCELPAGGGKFVWLGTTDAAGVGTCTLGAESDPTKCHPCTPVNGCLNTCEHCELCLGKPDLPADCLPPATGAGGSSAMGVGGAGNTGGAGGAGTTTGAGGTATCGGQLCPPGAQPCGLACEPLCPTGQYCLTGCCFVEPG